MTNNTPNSDMFSDIDEDYNSCLLQPAKGYSPHIGSLVAMMNFGRKWLVDSVKTLTQQQLDFQLDDKSNTIGAMLYHLAAVERAHQIITFREFENNVETIDQEWAEKWEIAQTLGEKAGQIKGHSIDYYLKMMQEVRDATKRELAKRDDLWLMQPTKGHDGKNSNYYWGWFHVCEHETYHRAQINLIKQRMPEA